MPKNRIVKLTDFNKLYESIPDAVIVNDNMLDTVDTSELIEAVFQKSNGVLEYTPTCKCKYISGAQFIGQLCTACGTRVSSVFANNYNPVNWIRIPPNMPKIIHPVFYIVLQQWIGKLRIGNRGTVNDGKKQKVPIIDFILNIEETLPEEIRDGVHGQGFEYFTTHMEEILRYLLLEHPKYSKHKNSKRIWAIYKQYKDILVLDKFPILHPAFHPLHAGGRIKHIDATADVILPALINIRSAEFKLSKCVTRSRYGERSIWKTFQTYIDYLKKVIELKLGDKYALIRRHLVAARCNFSGRGVIVPLTCRHEGDEIHLPWEIALNGLKFEIINVLVSRNNLTPTMALCKFMSAFSKFDQDIYDIMKTLIAECPTKGLPVLFGRNPTLIKDGIRLVFVPKIKKNIHDKSIAMSPRIVGGYNAEYRPICE